MNAGSSLILPQGINAMVKEMTKQTRAETERLAELVTIARARVSQPMDASPQGLLKIADKLLRHLPQTALFMVKASISPMTQINKVEHCIENCNALYEIVILADTDLPQALENLQAYHQKISMFDVVEKIPGSDFISSQPTRAEEIIPLDQLERFFNFDLISSQPTRALAAIATPDYTPPANLCKPFTATARLESGAASADSFQP